MIRPFVAAFAACLALATQSNAADLGQPRLLAVEDHPARPRIWSGCHASTSVSGHFLKDGRVTDNVAGLGLALGCDVQSGKLVYGGAVGFDFGRDDFRAATLSARLGYALNPHLLAYSLTTYTMDGRKPTPRDGIISLGAGLETWLGAVTVFGEATRDIKSVGGAGSIDEAWIIRGGARFRF